MGLSATDFPKVRKLADDLMATANPSEFWDQVEELNEAECKALDSIVFECVSCNHWFAARERREKYGEWVCKDCFED